jgi:aspartate-semialdehyde dehydrogenase
MDPEVPLVVPEVNGALLDARPRLVANGNCVAIPLTLVLHALGPLGRLESVVVASYQSVSGAGQEALDELERGIRGGLDGEPPLRTDGRPAFAYNVLPHIDRFDAEGWTGEERKIVLETRRMLGAPISRSPRPRCACRCASATAPRSWRASTAPWSRRRARAVGAAPGVRVVDEPGRERYPTPLEAVGEDDVLVGRARPRLLDRAATGVLPGLDNLRKGAALNAVQIAERLAGHPLAGPAAAAR